MIFDARSALAAWATALLAQVCVGLDVATTFTPVLLNHNGIFHNPELHFRPFNSHGPRSHVAKRQDSGECNYSGEITASAPKKNVFWGLTTEENVAVTAFLHEQEELNLTAAVNATL